MLQKLFRRSRLFTLQCGVVLSLFPILRHTSFNLTAADAVFAISIPLSVLAGVSKQNTLLRRLAGSWSLGCAGVVLGLISSSVINGDTARGAIVSSQYLFAYIGIGLCVWDLTAEEISHLLKWFLFGVAAVCLHGICVYFFAPGSTTYVSAGRLGGLLENPNRLAKTIGATIPVLLGLYFGKFIRPLTAITCAWLLVVALGLTGSIGGLLGAVFGISAFLVAGGYRMIRPSTFISIGIAGIIVLVTVPSIEVFERRVAPALSAATIMEGGSAQSKLDLVRFGLNQLSSSPIIGIGADESARISFSREPIHNTYVLLWVEGGLIAFLGWLTMLATGTVAALSPLRRFPLAAAMSFATLASFGFACLTNPHTYSRHSAVLILLVALLSAKLQSRASALTPVVDDSIRRRPSNI